VPKKGEKRKEGGDLLKEENGGQTPSPFGINAGQRQKTIRGKKKKKRKKKGGTTPRGKEKKTATATSCLFISI